MDLRRGGEADPEHHTHGSVAEGVDDVGLLTSSAAEAFAACFRSTYADVHAFVVRLVGVTMADDVVAETFATAWARWVHVPADAGEARAWVFGVAHNRVREARRSLSRRQRLLRRVAGLRESEVPSPDESVPALAHARSILDELPDGERDAVCLTVVAGLTSAQAARVLSCSVSAVTSRVSRARQRLATRLDDVEGR